MVITVVGLGFVGLTAAIGFAAKGHTVYGIEKNEERRATIAGGKVPFYEPGMPENLERTLNETLFIRESQDGCAQISDCIFYCVGTPVGESGSADLTYLKAAVEETLALLPKGSGTTLVVKSTVPMGALRDVIRPLVCARGFVPGEDLELANNPEFLREGKCWEDFMQADRLVIGAFTARGHEVVSQVYRDFEAPIHRVHPTTAEFIKYLSNTMLATMISYSNEMANAAACAGDVEIGEAFHILHGDRRWEQNVMSSYVYPGCGYGGYCLPKDTKAMLYAGTQAGAKMPILQAVIDTNEAMPQTICERILAAKPAIDPAERTIGILGLSFKPFTDDVRDSSAAKIIQCLRDRQVGRILAYDPKAEEEFQKYYPQLAVECPGDLKQVVGSCDTLAIVTAWPEFAPLLNRDNVLDFRYM